jgi:nitrite reductase (NADH) small subunit
LRLRDFVADQLLTTIQRMPWTTLCDLEELVEGQGHYVDIDGRELAVFLHRGRPYVMDNTCPHAGGSLSSGYVEEHAGTPCAVCPMHAWSFRLDNGEYFDMPGFEVRVYPVRVEWSDGRTLVQADLPMP